MLKVIDLNSDRSKITLFGDVLFAVSADNKMNQYQLAAATGFSASMMSRVTSGNRPLSKAFAKKLSEVLGGTEKLWLEVYSQTLAGSPCDISYFRSILSGDQNGENDRKSKSLDSLNLVKMLDGTAITSIFGHGDGEMEFQGVVEDCEIENFDPTAVQPTSYNACAGGYSIPTDLDKFHARQAHEEIMVPAGEVLLITTKEHFTMPSWISADIGTATSMAMKGLMISHGPIIDPGWSGFLKVAVFNPTRHVISVATTEPFLTLRFWMSAQS